MKYIKWLPILASVVIMLIAVTEIISYLRNPENYMLGSEAMIGNGGFKYKNELSFLLYYSLQILASLFSIIILLKSKQTIGFALGILLVLIQILFSVIIT